MSFSREIKDFIAAFQAGQKILGAHTDEEYKKARIQLAQAQYNKLTDPEMDKLNKEAIRARIRASDRAGTDIGGVRAAQAEAARETAALRRAQREALNRQAIPVVDPELINSATAYGQGLTFDVPAPQAIPTEDEEGAVPGYKRGGVVMHYANGGVVEEDEDNSEDDEVAIPEGPEPEPDLDDADLDAGVEVSAQSRVQGTQGTQGASAGFSVQAAHDAVRDGLTYGSKVFGLGQTAIPAPYQARGARSYLQGRGAITPQEMAAVRKAVDPEGKMSESERNLAALSSIYQFYLGRGDAEAAKRAAFGVLQYYRLSAQRYAALAAAAAKEGDIDGATRAALRAYANVPDGRDVKLTKNDDGTLTYTAVDQQTGKTISKGIATPAQIAAMAMKVSADGFDQFILQAAGQRASGGTGGTGGAPRGRQKQTPAEKDAETPYEERVGGEGGLREEMEKFLNEDRVMPGDTKTTPGTSFGALLKATGSEHLKTDYERLAASLAKGYRGHPRIPVELAFKLTSEINPDNINAFPSGIQVDPKNKTIKYRGATFHIDDETHAIMAALRGEAIRAAIADRKKKELDTEKARQKAEKYERDSSMYSRGIRAIRGAAPL